MITLLLVHFVDDRGTHDLHAFTAVVLQEDFMDKYESVEAILAKCYPSEPLNPSSAEMKEIFKNFQT